MSPARCCTPRRPACTRWPPALTASFAPRGRSAGAHHRPRGGVRHGQVRPRRPQGRRHACLHRDAGLFVHPAEASHGDLGMIVAGRCGARPVQLRRDRRTRRSGRAFPPVRPAAGGDHRPRRLHAGRGRRCRPDAAGGGGGLSHGPRPDHLDHHADGARRRHRRRPADPPRLHRRRLPPDPSRRPAGHPAPARPRPDARRATRCRSPRPTRRWIARCC